MKSSENLSKTSTVTSPSWSKTQRFMKPSRKPLTERSKVSGYAQSIEYPQTEKSKIDYSSPVVFLNALCCPVCHYRKCVYAPFVEGLRAKGCGCGYHWPDWVIQREDSPTEEDALYMTTDKVDKCHKCGGDTNVGLAHCTRCDSWLFSGIELKA